MARNGTSVISGWIVVAAWVLSALVAYTLVGGLLGPLIEGVDFALLPKAGLVIGGLATLSATALTIVWARGRGSEIEVTDSSGMGRRRFLAGAATTVGGLAATGGAAFARISGWATVTGPALSVETPVGADAPQNEWAGARVRAYRRLGRTNFEVSDISLGSSKIRGEMGERVARMAIERGVNYFDTAPDYAASGSETALGRAMKGHRDKMFLATKFCTAQGHLSVGSPPEAYVSAVEASLKRLQTDYVDLIHIHACDSVERLLDPGVHEAFARLKRDGKARFLGFSSHTPNLETVARTALDDGRFDVMMLAYHHGAWPKLREIVKEAAQKDVGVVAMKTLKGAHHRGLLETRAEADSYTQAAFKWVLSDPNVSCLVISFRKPENVDEYLHASGQVPGAGDYAALAGYDRAIDGIHCYQHCGDCLGACPLSVPIDDVLRYRMYFEDYGEEKEAIRLYSALDQRADACSTCPAPCANACTHGIAIPERIREAHDLLTLA